MVSDIDLTRMLNKCQVNFKEIQPISRRCWNDLFDKHHEANDVTTIGKHILIVLSQMKDLQHTYQGIKFV